MSFKMRITHGETELCDKCKKASTPERPLVDMWTTGRHYDQRSLIQVHEDCLLRGIVKAKREAIEVPA